MKVFKLKFKFHSSQAANCTRNLSRQFISGHFIAVWFNFPDCGAEIKLKQTANEIEPEIAGNTIQSFLAPNLQPANQIINQRKLNEIEVLFVD